MFVVEFVVCWKIPSTHRKSSICFCFCRLTFAFLALHDSTPPCERCLSELWLSAAVSGNVQVIPVDTVTTRAPFYSHLSFYTEVFGQALLLLFGTRIGATHKKKSYKQMIVMLNLVLIDVICIVSFAVYGSICLMWDCTYVLWVVEFKFVYYQLCFEFIASVFVHQMFWWMWTFFFYLKKGFLQKHEHHRTKISFTNTQLLFVEVVIKCFQ